MNGILFVNETGQQHIYAISYGEIESKIRRLVTRRERTPYFAILGITGNISWRLQDNKDNQDNEGWDSGFTDKRL